MKLRKILSSVIAGAMALSAMTFSASAEGATVLDFEDGAFTGISMKTDDGGDKSVLSVVDYNGSKQLLVDIQNATRVPKVFFNIGEIVGYDNMDKVAKISLDLTIQSTLILDDSDPENIWYEIPSWQGGGAGCQDGEGGSLGWTDVGGWSAEEYENASKTITYTADLGSARFTNGTEGSHFLFMKWAGTEANPVDMYIDNVVFYDADGNALELYPVAEEATEEEATEEEATEEEATEEDAAEEEAEEEVAEEEEAEEEVAEEETEEDAAEEEVEEDAAEEEVVEEVEEEEAPATGDVDASTDSSKGSPDTGVEDVAVVAGLAIVAAGAVLVSKKRK